MEQIGVALAHVCPPEPLPVVAQMLNFPATSASAVTLAYSVSAAQGLTEVTSP
jgi:hypothetical protein